MMMTKKQLEKMARIYHMMSDPSRLSIILVLSKNETNVTALCKKLHMSQPTVSRHLSLLKFTGIAEARRNGKEIFYSLLPESRKKLNALIAKGLELL